MRTVHTAHLSRCVLQDKTLSANQACKSVRRVAATPIPVQHGCGTSSTHVCPGFRPSLPPVASLGASHQTTPGGSGAQTARQLYVPLVLFSASLGIRVLARRKRQLFPIPQTGPFAPQLIIQHCSCFLLASLASALIAWAQCPNITNPPSAPSFPQTPKPPSLFGALGSDPFGQFLHFHIAMNTHTLYHLPEKLFLGICGRYCTVNDVDVISVPSYCCWPLFLAAGLVQ